MREKSKQILQAAGLRIKKQAVRAGVLALLLAFLASTAIPTASAVALSIEASHAKTGIDKHATPLDQKTTTQEHSFGSPGGMAPTIAKNKAAADTRAVGTLSQLGKTAATGGEALKGIAEKPKITPHELTDRRTATSSVSVAADGSLHERRYAVPQFFKQDGSWKTINNTLSEDKNAGDAGTAVGRAFGQVESWLSPTTTFKASGNAWESRFAPSNSDKGMVRIKKGNDQIGLAPVNAKSVAPVITTDKDGKQTVHYYDLWPGVNVEYSVHNDSVKENIILKDKNATNKVDFKVIGANLKQKDAGDNQGHYYQLQGSMNDEFAVAPANLILNNFGFVTENNVFNQSYDNGTITLSVDKNYLNNLPGKAFPAVIDPTFRSTFGTRAGGNYVSLKSDGYVCYSNVCNPYAGSLFDSNNVLRYWRGAFMAPYDQFRDGNNILTNATLHLTQRTNAGFWTGTYDAHTYYVGHAVCLNGFNCLEGNAYNVAGGLATVGDINVTSIYQLLISRGDFGGWLMIGGEDGSYSSFKNFDPDNTFVDFTYGGPPAAPSIATPTANQVYTDLQPSFSVNSMSNPNGSTPLQYEVLVSSGLGASGALITSGKQNASQWTIPDGILQDGSTYYVQARSFDPITNAYSGWGTSVPFRIDSRNGKNASQTYDNLGPVSVDLATGNVSTATSSHSSDALGGALGVGLNYNSPLKSRNGLVGKYWNVAANYSGGLPSSPPQVTRVDQNVDFNWNSGSPSAGTINNDWFFAAWDGYFVAPTTGTYYFGGNEDDVLTVTVNGQQQYAHGGCYTGICYGTNSITLQAGQTVPIHIEYQEATSPAYAHVYVKGPVDEQILPNAWLQTGVRPVADQHGLTGSYFAKQDGTDTFSSGNPMVMKRLDPYMSFDWGSGAPVAGGPNDFLVRWSGYVTVPVSGTYNFGSISDDGTKITVGAGSNSTVVYNDWTPHGPTEGYGSGYAMTANTPVPITIEYFDSGGPAMFQLKVQGAVAQQIVPTAWLSPSAQVLPAGWSLGLSGSGNYQYLKPGQNSVTLVDATGTTHEYSWNGSGYKPPVNEDGNLVRNADGTYTLQDSDGLTYVFGTDGTLTSVTGAVDDRKPAALQYEYQSQNGGPVHLSKIKDGVDTSRTATLYYSGDTQCGSAPTGFDAQAPAGMLCALQTNDGRTTNFYYIQGQLARVAQPGNLLTDYGYQAVQNDQNQTIGYRLSSVRDPLTMDAIAAGKRSNDATVNTSIDYDAIGRAVSVTQPAPTANAVRVQHTIEYLPGVKAYVDTNGVTIPGYAGLTKEHVVNDSEPNGFTRRIKYDNLYRTVEATDKLNQSVTTEWDPAKDIVYSTTDPTGLKSTKIYDDEDRPVATYGPAPKEWFDSSNPKNQVPLSTYTNQVARAESTYDGGIVGPSVAWYDYQKQTGNTNGALWGAPKLHTTGLNPATSGVLDYAFTTPPITAGSGMQGIGFSATGKLRLPNGTYTINADTSDGIRIWVDDQLILGNQWIDSASRTVTSTSFTVSDSAPKRFRIDAYRKTGSSGAFQARIQQQGGFTYTTNWSSYLKPDYGLTTSSKSYDQQIGDTTSTTNFGLTPELSQPQSVTVDSGGLNLTSTNTFEAQGATGSLLRPTSSTTAGNASSNPTNTYTYYGATETRDTPCTSQTEAYKQAGRIKKKTEADPDGAGAQTARTTEYIYDDAGRVVASRYNNESWTCVVYDSRGRVTISTTPAWNGEPVHRTQYDYAVGGDPLEVTQWDENGWIVVWTDLLGRTVKYRDVHDDETTTSYDTFGRMNQRISPVGTETFEYDNYGRPTVQKLDNTVYSTVVYGQYGRVDHVDYNNAGQLRNTPSYDNFGRANSLTYRMGDGTTSISDTLAYTQSGKVMNDVVQSGSNQLWSNFSYDKAGRLTTATTGPHTFTYGFGTQNSSCTGSNMNANSGKNGNRTSQTIDGVSTTFCYDNADRLVASSDATANYAEYDSHGNMTYLGTGAKPTRFCYDASDRNSCIVQRDDNADSGTAIYYTRDAQGRIVYREQDNIDHWNWNLDHYTFNGYTGAGDGPSFVRDANWNIIEKTIQLPGGVMLTIKPNEAVTNNQKQYTLSSALGRTLLTANAAGTNTSTGNGPLSSYTYDPFGNVIQGSTLPPVGPNGSYGFGGPLQKATESLLTLMPIQMGARVYLPTIGRFTSMDPVPGGNVNGYAYGVDPINTSDYSGRCLQACGNSGSILQPAGGANLQPTISVYVLQPATRIPLQGSGAVRNVTLTIAKTIPRAPAPPAPKPRDTSTAMGVATVRGVELTKINPHPYGETASGAAAFHPIQAINSGMDYYKVGSSLGAGLGCGAGAIITLEAAGAGCLLLAPTGYLIGGILFGTYGFIEGALGASDSEVFSTPPGPDLIPDAGSWRR